MARSDRFRACLAETLRWEGGWSDHPRDRGGPTMQGVTIYRYADHMGYPRPVRGTPEWDHIKAELRQIPRATLEEIYYRWYWLPVRGDELPVGIDQLVFDFAVNSGHPRAIRYLQRELGIRIDSDIGPATLAAARNAGRTDLVRRYCNARREFLRQCKAFDVFGRGWMSRVDGIEAAAMRQIHAQAPVAANANPLPDWITTTAPPLPDPDQQAARQGKSTVEEPVFADNAALARAAEAGGTLGTANAAVQVSSALERARVHDGFDWITFALSLAQSPAFWITAGAIVSAGYVWFVRRRQVQVL